MWFLSYWIVPIISSSVWLAMLIAMLVTWSVQGSPHYASMNANQSIAYISDVGAQGLKPLFITMSAVTVVTLNITFILERWLRHTGRLASNTSIWQKIYSGISIVGAIVGAVGLILLTIFDTLRHDRLHNVFLGVFIVGYIVSAVFICWQYQRLGIHFREHSVLRYSFWIKLFFILLEAALAIAFAVTNRNHKYNAAAVIEWTIAFIFFFYVLSFSIDFIPAVRRNHYQDHKTEMDMAHIESDAATGDGAANSERYYRANGNEHENIPMATSAVVGMPGYMNRTADGHKPPEPAQLPSRNF